jgi:hypothetical protein
VNHLTTYKIFESDDTKLYWRLLNNEWDECMSERVSIDAKNIQAIMDYNNNLVGGQFSVKRWHKDINYLKFESKYHVGIHDVVHIWGLTDEYFAVSHNNISTRLYKCDGIEGVIELLSSILRNKYHKVVI